MDQLAIVRYITGTFAGVDVLSPNDGIAAGDTFFYYDPHRNRDPKRSFPFATIVTHDYDDFDCASNLNRPGVFRLNIGISQETYRSLFGPPAARTDRAGDVEAGPDFGALDQLLPHPEYAVQSWVCVLNPSDATFRTIQPLLAEAYDRVASRQPAHDRPGQP